MNQAHLTGQSLRHFESAPTLGQDGRGHSGEAAAVALDGKGTVWVQLSADDMQDHLGKIRQSHPSAQFIQVRDE